MNKSIILLPMAIACALGGCKDEHLSFNSLVDAIDNPPAAAIASEQMQPYAQNGGVTWEQVDNLNRTYAKKQSYRAMRNLLGAPNEVSSDRDVYYIRGSGNNAEAPRRLQVLYRESSDCNYQCTEAYSWYYH